MPLDKGCSFCGGTMSGCPVCWSPPDGWIKHPTAEGYYYKDNDVLTRAELAAMDVERKPVESNPVAKFFNSKQTSRALAVKAMCAHCMGCTLEATEPGFRSMIRDCAAGPDSRAPCPLHGFRPYQRDDDEE